MVYFGINMFKTHVYGFCIQLIIILIVIPYLLFINYNIIHDFVVNILLCWALLLNIVLNDGHVVVFILGI